MVLERGKMPRRKTEEEPMEVSDNTEDVEKLIEVSDQKIKERVAEYERDFEAKSLTAIDKMQIRHLAKMELAGDRATSILNASVNLTAAQRKALTDSAKSAMGEARQIADSLGMSRKARLTDEDSEMNDYLPKLHDEALNFLHERGVFIVCPSCRKEQPRVEIRSGMIIFNFEFEMDWVWRSKCPRCGKKFEINSSNYQSFKVPKTTKITADTKEEELEDDDEFSGEDPDQD